MSSVYFLSLIELQRSAVILAGGFSRRFGSDNGSVILADKPLVIHVIERVSELVDEVLLVVSSENQKKTFEPILENKATGY